MTNEKEENEIRISKGGKIFDLESRTKKFSFKVIAFVKKIKINTINHPVISQLIRSATSIGANYMEADCAESKSDFRHKIAISKKESKETVYWLDVLAETEPELKTNCVELKKEAVELNLIFSSIIRSCSK